MAIKAHKDMMEKGAKLLDDPTLNNSLKRLVKEEMENSQRCMKALGLEEAA